MLSYRCVSFSCVTCVCAQRTEDIVTASLWNEKENESKFTGELVKHVYKGIQQNSDEKKIKDANEQKFRSTIQQAIAKCMDV